MTESNIEVLIVDDNPSYREAFSRNLEIMDFTVKEAENGDEAIRLLRQEGPLVLVTDLQMRTNTEGLDLIREARALYPLLPIIMISAVGTFEEGALAQKFGAAYVIHKSRIEEEIDALYTLIKQAAAQYRQNAKLLDQVYAIRAQENPGAAETAALQEILSRPNAEPFIKSEAYDALLNLQSSQEQAAAQSQAANLARGETATIDKVVAQLGKVLPFFDSLDEQTKEGLKTAEFLYMQQESDFENVDFSRNIGFSYCFAVENEVKIALRNKLKRFLGANENYALIRNFIDAKRGQLDIFYHQFLLQEMHQRDMEITTDNVRQTFERILQHQRSYKPDGLKAVGIVLFCFGRNYKIKSAKQTIDVDNPLNIKFVSGENGKVDELAGNLIGLQHYRNPYIHPEISDMQKISKVRQSSLDCLLLMKQMI